MFEDLDINLKITISRLFILYISNLAIRNLMTQRIDHFLKEEKKQFYISPQ